MNFGAEPQWVPLVKRAAEAGVADPALLVFLLKSGAIELPARRWNLGGGYPRAIETVAQALGLAPAEVQARYLERTWRRSDAHRLVAEARSAVPTLRAALPEAEVSELTTTRMDTDPTFLASFARYVVEGDRLAQPPPRQSREWRRIIDALRAGGEADPDALVVLARFCRVELTPGEVAEPLEIEDAYLTVALALGEEPAAFQRASEQRLSQASLISGPNPGAASVLLEGQLRALPFVSSFERLQETFPPTLVGKHTPSGQTMPGPWEAFPEPPSSLRWRMGPGESYRHAWMDFWRKLSAEERRVYLAEHPFPEAWKDWMARW